MKLKFTLLFLLVTCSFVAFSQKAYMLSPENQALDSIGYVLAKTKYLDSFKEKHKDKIITIKEDFTEIRRNKDSIIYNYDWKIFINDPNNSFYLKSKMFEDKWLNKPLIWSNLKLISGQEIKLEQLIGKPTMINLWFTSCKPCVEEIPTLNKLKEKLGDSVNFVSVTFNDSNKVQTFLNKIKFNFDHVVDAKDYLNSLENTSYPKNIFVDKKGIIREITGGLTAKKNSDGTYQTEDETRFLNSLYKLLNQ